MTGIIERLRTVDVAWSEEGEWCAEAADEIERLRAENKRLEAALRYEQHRGERIGTHGTGCWSWGPQHWECAVRKIESLRNIEGDKIGAGTASALSAGLEGGGHDDA